MNRSTFLATAGGAIVLTAIPRLAEAAESTIALTTPTGKLSGTLTLPASAPPYPAVLIIPGSGAVDRDGNSGEALRSDAYKLLAAALAKAGIASLRYDKRGVGASMFTASVKNATFETMIDDAAGWVKVLAADKRVSGVTVAGHSEGALIGTIVAQRMPVRALVLLEGAGRPAPAVLREQLEARLPEELYVQADAIISQLQAGHTVLNPPQELAALLRPGVQPYLISWFKYDPAAELAKVRAPVTIVQGTADIQVTMTDAQALAHADPSAKLVVVDGMNHMLKYFPDHSSMQSAMKGYLDPSLPVDEKVVAAVEASARERL